MPDPTSEELQPEVLEQPAEEVTEAPAETSPEESAAPEGEAEEVIVTIGDEQPTEEDELKQAPAWVKDLRKANREKDRRIRELEARVASTQQVQPEIVVGEKPTLAACGYDEEKFDTELSAWHDRKRKAEEVQRVRQEEARKAQESWQQKLQSYAASKTALRVKDFEEAEEVVLQTLSQTQQGIIVQGSKQPSLLVYALGKNPKKAAELAAIKDPVQFAVAIGELGAQLKVQSRKPATAPESRAPRSSVAGATAVDDELQRLQEKANKTGDRTAVAAYLRNKARQSA